jgi:hypothetical protein
MSWVEGYVSAIATTAAFPRGANAAWMFGVLDGYCGANRTGTLADAARLLADRLKTPR